jgi:hypothetical protein
MERMNGELRDRERVMRTLESTDTPILKGMEIFHNYVRPHMARRENTSRSGGNTGQRREQVENHNPKRGFVAKLDEISVLKCLKY